MKGKFTFRVHGNNSFYEFELKRNITMLQGDSGTGKTTLLEILLQYLRNGEASGYSVETDANYYVFMHEPTQGTWHDELDNLRNTVIFIEENNQFVMNRSFASFVKASGNYFVIINRASIKCLLYSTKEMYELESELSEDGYTQIYHFKEIYPKELNVFSKTDLFDFKLDLVITEDSNTGFRFFKNFFNVNVDTAGGNSKILQVVGDFNKSNLLCIADGAAYGAYMQQLYEYINSKFIGQIVLWIPESFEYLLLKAKVIDFDGLNEILENTYNFVECSKFSSWERFFTSLAIENSSKEHKYKKNSEDDYYCNNEGTRIKIRKVLPMNLQKFSIPKNKNSEQTTKMSLF